jgi:hypothetical protein
MTVKTGEDAETLRIIESRIQADFKNGLPPHLQPNAKSREYVPGSDQSRIFVSRHSDFSGLHARDIQSILRQRLILVHGVPIDYDYGWDLESISRLYDVDKKTNVHGEVGIPFKNICLNCISVLSKVDPHHPEHRYHQGTLRELHNLTQTLPEGECPPLNAISLPVDYGNLYIPPQFRSIASHEVAQNRLPTHYRTAFDVPDIKAKMEWSLVGSKGAVSPLHVDSEGFGTVIVVLEGSKYWVVVTRFGDQESISSVDSLGPAWNPYFVNDGDNSARFRFEGLHLQKGDML